MNYGTRSGWTRNSFSGHFRSHAVRGVTSTPPPPRILERAASIKGRAFPRGSICRLVAVQADITTVISDEMYRVASNATTRPSVPGMGLSWLEAVF